MRSFYISILLALSSLLWSDGMSIEYVTLELLGNLDQATPIQVESVDFHRGFIMGKPLEHPLDHSTESGNARRYHFHRHESYPGEWTIVFEYWNLLSFQEYQPGTTCIAIPRGNQFIFIRDTPWNWQKIQWFTQEPPLVERFSRETSETLMGYLWDPDVALQAYEVLRSRGQMTHDLVLHSFRNDQIDYSRFRSSYNFMGFLFQYHLNLLNEEDQELFLERTVEFLREEYIPILGWMLDYHLEMQDYTPVELYVEYQRIHYLNSKDIRPPSALIYLYEEGVPLETLEPALYAWAFILPEDEDFQNQRYTLEALIPREFRQEDQLRFLIGLADLWARSPNPQAHRGLMEYLPELIDTLAEPTRESLRQELREHYPGIAELLGQ